VTDVQRDLGRLEARQDGYDERLERIESKVDQLVEWTSQSKGGVRMLIAVGSIAATLAGLLGAWISKVLHPGAQS
jgi:hypothetical protein